MSDLWTFTLVHWQHCYFNSYFSVLFITSSGNYPNSHDIEHSFESAFRSYFGMQTFFDTVVIFSELRKKRHWYSLATLSVFLGTIGEGIWNWNVLGNVYHVLTIITGFGQRNQSNLLTNRLVNHHIMYLHWFLLGIWW